MRIALSIAAVFLVMNLATFVAYSAVTDLVRSYGLRGRR
jgi:hypothetical protein